MVSSRPIRYIPKIARLRLIRMRLRLALVFLLRPRVLWNIACLIALNLVFRPIRLKRVIRNRKLFSALSRFQIKLVFSIRGVPPKENST